MTAQDAELNTKPDVEIENAARDRHQLRTLTVAITTISVVLSMIAATIVYVIALNQLWFLHFPLGFYLLAQGLLFFVVFIGFWYVRAQERIDHTRAMNEEIA